MIDIEIKLEVYEHRLIANYQKGALNAPFLLVADEVQSHYIRNTYLIVIETTASQNPRSSAPACGSR